jgi:hypothetical protein
MPNGLVELVHRDEADEHDEREQRLAAAHLLEELAGRAGQVASRRRRS